VSAHKTNTADQSQATYIIIAQTTNHIYINRREPSNKTMTTSNNNAYTNIPTPHSRAEEKAQLRAAIAASLGQPVDEDDLWYNAQQPSTNSATRHRTTPSSSPRSARPGKMSIPNGVFC